MFYFPAPTSSLQKKADDRDFFSYIAEEGATVRPQKRATVVAQECTKHGCSSVVAHPRI